MPVVVQATVMGTAPGMEMVPETGTGTAATAPVGAVDDIKVCGPVGKSLPAVTLWSENHVYCSQLNRKREEQNMDAIQTAEYARALLSAHGGKAEAEAARKTRENRAAGNTVEADRWEAIRKAIIERRGPRQT
jgi:hypothetical protein